MDCSLSPSQQLAYRCTLPPFALQDLGQRLGGCFLQLRGQEASYPPLSQGLCFHHAERTRRLKPVVVLGNGWEGMFLYMRGRYGYLLPYEVPITGKHPPSVLFYVSA